MRALLPRERALQRVRARSLLVGNPIQDRVQHVTAHSATLALRGGANLLSFLSAASDQQCGALRTHTSTSFARQRLCARLPARSSWTGYELTRGSDSNHIRASESASDYCVNAPKFQVERVQASSGDHCVERRQAEVARLDLRKPRSDRTLS